MQTNHFVKLQHCLNYIRKTVENPLDLYILG